MAKKQKRHKPKHNLKWIKQTLDLPDQHHWTASPGCNVFVADQGAVRLDIPQEWHIQPQETSFQFTDKEPPADDCRLELSYNRLPPADWTAYPLDNLLQKLVDEDPRPITSRGPVHAVNRVALRMLWIEVQFIDPNEHREARSRIAIGLGNSIQCLLTLDYWLDDADTLAPVWDTALNSLTLGLFIQSPTLGAARPD